MEHIVGRKTVTLYETIKKYSARLYPQLYPQPVENFIHSFIHSLCVKLSTTCG